MKGVWCIQCRRRLQPAESWTGEMVLRLHEADEAERAEAQQLEDLGIYGPD